MQTILTSLCKWYINWIHVCFITESWLTFLIGDVGVPWLEDSVGVVAAAGAACVLEVWALVTEAIAFVLSMKNKQTKNLKSLGFIGTRLLSFPITISLCMCCVCVCTFAHMYVYLMVLWVYVHMHAETQSQHPAVFQWTWSLPTAASLESPVCASWRWASQVASMSAQLSYGLWSSEFWCLSFICWAASPAQQVGLKGVSRICLYGCGTLNNINKLGHFSNS